MGMLRLKRTMIWAGLLALLFPFVGRAKTKEDINKQLVDAITAIRKAKKPAARNKAAQRLGAIT